MGSRPWNRYEHRSYGLSSTHDRGEFTFVTFSLSYAIYTVDWFINARFMWAQGRMIVAICWQLFTKCGWGCKNFDHEISCSNMTQSRLLCKGCRPDFVWLTFAWVGIMHLWWYLCSEFLSSLFIVAFFLPLNFMYFQRENPTCCKDFLAELRSLQK